MTKAAPHKQDDNKALRVVDHHSTTSISVFGLSREDTARLNELYAKGTPANSIRAWESDLSYLTTWKQLRFGADLEWPEQENVALTFVLDHSRDLTLAEAQDPARVVAEALIKLGLRRKLEEPAVSSLDRKIASWRSFHRMRNIASPFEAPILRQTRQKARKAMAKLPTPKSANPITKDLLLKLMSVAGSDNRGLRDKAILGLGWGSGGRRRSEIVSLDVKEIDLRDYAEKKIIWIQLLGTKTTKVGETPRLILKGVGARAVVAWINASGITDGPLFRRVSRHDTIGANRLDAGSIANILKRLLRLAGLPEDYASPHGLRSGFLTQAALDRAPLQAAMKLSLHRSAIQAQRYYADVDIADNPAADLLGDD